MSIRITKTPNQAELENMKKRKERTCPYCNYEWCLGIVRVKEGILKAKEVRCYTCSNCGCEWEVE